MVTFNSGVLGELAIFHGRRYKLGGEDLAVVLLATSVVGGLLRCLLP